MMLHTIKNKLSSVKYILAGACILLVIPFYNGYPLVYSDTGTYLYSGFDLFVPHDRPATYGLFIRYTSFKTSLWLTVIAQAILTSWVLFLCCKRFLYQRNVGFIFLLITLFLMLLSGIGWYSGQIMPDFFTPIAILSMLLILLSKKGNSGELFAPGSILVLTMICHFSHLLIVVFLLFFVFIATRLLRRSDDSLIVQIPLKRFGLSAVLIGFAWILLPSIHYAIEGKFSISKGSHGFLMAHLADTGILQKFLTENCDKEEYRFLKLCELKDGIPNNNAEYLWNPNGIFEQTGGWEGSKKENTYIINAMLRDPGYLMMNISKASIYATSQLFQYEIGEGLSPYTEGSAPYGQVHWRFKDELNQYLNSRQQRFNGVSLQFERLNHFHLVILILSMFIFLGFFYFSSRGINDELRLVCIIILSGILANALITGGLVAPYARLQARVNWLFIFAAILILLRHGGDLIRYLKSGLKIQD